jgi:hypothetical protein
MMKEMVKHAGNRQRVYRIESWIIGSFAYADVKQQDRDGGFKTYKTFTTDISQKNLDDGIAEVEKAAEDFVETL